MNSLEHTNFEFGMNFAILELTQDVVLEILWLRSDDFFVYYRVLSICRAGTFLYLENVNYVPVCNLV